MLLTRVLYAFLLSHWVMLFSMGSASADPILTVELPDEVRTFTLEELGALDQETFTTKTIWTEGDQTFTGVPLRALVEELGLSTASSSGAIEAIAINDYSVTIPLQDALAEGPLVAYYLNGKPMSVRDKGPLWIVYPYSSSADFQTEIIYSRSIWQLVRLRVRN